MSNLKFKANVTDYASADAFLDGWRGRTLGHNTEIERGFMNDDIVVLYHGNVIARYFKPDADGTSVSVFTNARWGTVTTRDRLNKLSPAGIRFSQRDNVQRVTYLDTDSGTLDEEFSGTLTVTTYPDGTYSAENIR
jgi:hypothetical protein